MSTPQPNEESRKIEEEREAIRAMSDGELLSIKDRNRRDFRQMLAEMELEAAHACGQSPARQTAGHLGARHRKLVVGRLRHRPLQVIRRRRQ
jgi:hypothetical protein